MKKKEEKGKGQNGRTSIYWPTKRHLGMANLRTREELRKGKSERQNSKGTAVV